MNATESGFIGATPPPPQSPQADPAAPQASNTVQAPPVPPRPAAGPEPVPGVTKDRHGTPYDPARHVPTMHPRTGAWLPRRRPKSAAPAGPSFIAPDPQPVPAGADPAAPVGSQQVGPTVPNIVEHATAETIIGLFQTALVLIGENEGALTEVEKTMLRQPLIRVLDKYAIGRDVMPAEVELAVCCIALVIERIKKGGKTATSFAKFRAWAGRMFWGQKGAALGRRIEKEVPADLVASLEAENAKLRAEMAARAAPVAAPVPAADAAAQLAPVLPSAAA